MDPIKEDGEVETIEHLSIIYNEEDIFGLSGGGGHAAGHDEHDHNS